jgi:hypothetical protein
MTDPDREMPTPGISLDETLSMALYRRMEASASDITIHEDAPRGNTSKTPWALIERPQSGNRSPPRDRPSSSSREVAVSSPDVLLNDSAFRRKRPSPLLALFILSYFLFPEERRGREDPKLH